MKKRMFLIVLSVSLFLTCASITPTLHSPNNFSPLNKATNESTVTPSPSEDPSSPNLLVDSNIEYARVSSWPTRLDVYALEGTGPLPIAIVVHGMALTRSDFSALAEGIAEKGVVVYNIDVNHNPPFEASVHRIACAVRFARATANDYSGDSQRIVLVGDSAGALTGLIVALAGDDFGDQCVFEDGTALFDGFIGYEGVFEFITYVKPDSMKHLDFTHLEEEDHELWLALNPYTHIGGNPGLQVRLVYGDFVESSMIGQVPVEEWSTNLHQALEDADYDVELIVVEGADHDDVFDSGSDAFTQVIDLVAELVHNPSK